MIYQIGWSDAELLFPQCSALWDIEIARPVLGIFLSKDRQVLWVFCLPDSPSEDAQLWCTFSNVAPTWHIINNETSDQYPQSTSLGTLGTRLWTDDTIIKFKNQPNGSWFKWNLASIRNVESTYRTIL